MFPRSDGPAARNVVPFSAYRPQISTSDSLWDARFYGARATPFSEETRLDDSRREGGREGRVECRGHGQVSLYDCGVHDRQWSSIVLLYFLFFFNTHTHTHTSVFLPSFTNSSSVSQSKIQLADSSSELEVIPRNDHFDVVKIGKLKLALKELH